MRKHEHSRGGKLQTLVLLVLPIILAAAAPAALAAEAVLTLNMALSKAAAEHPSVGTAERNLESAHLSVDLKKSENGLKLSTSLTPLQYSSRRGELGQRLSLDGSFSGVTGLGASASITWSSDQWMEKEDEADVTIGVTWNLWPNPKYSTKHLSLIDAREKVDIAQAELEAARSSALVDVYKSYRLLQIQEARASLAEKAYETQAQLYQQVVDKYEKGLASQSDVLSAKTAMEKSKSNYKKAARDLALDIAQFAKVLGLDKASNWKLEPLPESMKLVPVALSEEEAIALAERNSANLMQKEQAVKAAERSLQAAVADKGLGVSVTGSVSFDEELADPSYGAFVSVNYDLFDGGARKIQIEQLRLNLAKAQDDLETAKHELVRTIQSSLSELEWLSDQVAIAQLDLERARLGYQAKQAQRKQGLISLIELMEAETQLEESRLNWLEALVNYEAMRLNFMQQTGQALDIEGGDLH